ncbi:hypothetical protein RM549_09675 [Salegentibacter sp. F188]|uniref:Uncharacterized protein n=1 Tax=Autumnicola patrickiae TaxID=3075591 RepID=A0ABU3E248_9FLAO|nr:hypothetical protein [Salegentibacter sp. F188]MDT0690052.1 hypothetical protein [Salegentibacter sp. F188]
MFLERIAVITLQLRAKLQDSFNYVLRETDSQLGQVLITCCFFFLTTLLYFVWTTPSSLWIQISFTVIYLISFLLSMAAVYFFVRRKRIRNRLNTLEVYSIDDDVQEKFQHFDLRVIQLNKDQANAIFEAFSVKHFCGSYKSFQSLILLEPISFKERLEWKDPSPKSQKQVNRQTLLEFLSQLMIGFERLENHQMMQLVEHYFILKNSEGTEQTLSTKNISDWRNNKATYLKDISGIFKINL